jgi:SAM-dependent methyltransferase
VATERDKYKERIRYEQYSRSASLETYGSASIPKHLRTPYVFYELELQRLLSSQIRVLELGAGTGTHSSIPKTASETVLLDISSSSLHVNLNSPPLAAHGVCGDIELLPFSNATFHLVCGAGILSYGDTVKVQNEIERILLTGGSLVLVDSLNTNPIYRINRRIHWLRGQRTVSTLRSMPSQRSIYALAAQFHGVNVQYFDHWVFLFPVLRLTIGRQRAAVVIKWLNATISPNWMAFKLVLVATNFQGSTNSQLNP